jgi:RNA polymerase-binding transcription factor DksA
MSHKEMKTSLESELITITSELEIIAKKNPNSNDWVATPATRETSTADKNVVSDSAEEWNERRAIVAQLEIRYGNILRAIEKFTIETYGICEISGEPIENERLKANPAARTNIANMDKEQDLPF